VDAQIRTAGLAKTYHVGFWGRRVRAVENLSFEVRKGEIFALLGPNGAGKTTTIKMLLGFVRPSAGKAFISSEPAGSVASRRKLGYLPENPARKQADRLLERVGLAGRADRAIRKFSKGMVQRLGLAQALVGDPETVILDEPMSGLDPIGRKDVRDIILDLRNEGRTVLFSTHILSDVEAICDRVGIMVEGRLTDIGALHDLVAPGARAVELVVEGLRPELSERFAREGAAVLERDRSIVLTFKAEAAAREALAVALAAGAAVVSFTPHRRSLEELFVERARGKAATS